MASSIHHAIVIQPDTGPHLTVTHTAAGFRVGLPEGDPDHEVDLTAEDARALAGFLTGTQVQSALQYPPGVR